MASPVRAPGSGHRRTEQWPWDVVGAMIVVALAGWALVASSGRDSARPLPVLALLATATIVFTLGRRWSRRREPLVPCLVGAAIAGSFVVTFPGVLSAGGAPTGYGNTNGTLAGLGAIAATAAAASVRGDARRAWFGTALLLVACVGFSESVAAGAALAVVAALALVAVARRDAAVAALGGLVTTWGALATTAALAAGASTLDVPAQALRVGLWSRALDGLRDAPLRGHGPGSYALQLAAFDDLDLRWAHHGYLQVAAEMGAVGLVLGLALLAWLYAYLWWGRRRGLARTVTGASATSLVALHATVDHVLHTAVLVLTLALLAGWATGDPRPAQPLRRSYTTQSGPSRSTGKRRSTSGSIAVKSARLVSVTTR